MSTDPTFHLFSGPSAELQQRSVGSDPEFTLERWMGWLRSHIEHETPLVKAFVGNHLPEFPRLDVRPGSEDDIAWAAEAQGRERLPEALCEFLLAAGRTVHPILNLTAPLLRSVQEDRDTFIDLFRRAHLGAPQAAEGLEPFIVLRYNPIGSVLLLRDDGIDDAVYLYQSDQGVSRAFDRFDAYLCAVARDVARSLLTGRVVNLGDAEWDLFGSDVRAVRPWCEAQAEHNPYTMPISHPSVSSAAHRLLGPSPWHAPGEQIETEIPPL